MLNNTVSYHYARAGLAMLMLFVCVNVKDGQNAANVPYAVGLVENDWNCVALSANRGSSIFFIVCPNVPDSKNALETSF